MFETQAEQDWLAVLGRSMACIAMKNAEVGDKISDRAAFLENLGLNRKEIAVMLGSSAASISELLRQRSKKEEANGKVQKGRK